MEYRINERIGDEIFRLIGQIQSINSENIVKIAYRAGEIHEHLGVEMRKQRQEHLEKSV